MSHTQPNEILPQRRPGRRHAGAILAFALPALAAAADLEIALQGLITDKGEVGIALFSSADGFPMDNAKAAARVWVPAQRENLQYRFEGLAPGTYAVAVSQDLNGNRKLDTNWVGMPKEPWAVTNNVRPALRPPRFEEAKVSVAADAPTRVTITLSR